MSSACLGGMVFFKNQFLSYYDMFQTLTRFLGTFDKVGLAVTGIMKAFSWNRIGIIAQKHTDVIWMYTMDAVKSMADDHGMHVAISKTFNGSENLYDLLKQVAMTSKSKIN